ncbi:MAG: LytTR family DNA-binding domain-containing protein [Chitinophagales bacterium]
MQILIVEDDRIAVEVLLEYLEEVDSKTNVEVAHSIKSARAKLNTEQYNLIFLDIHLKDGNGTEIINALPANQKIIFTTSDPDYAIKAFELNALDYLLKPIAKDRFNKAFQKVIDQTDDEEDIVFRADYNFHRVAPSDIYYIKSNADYLTMVTKDESYTFYGRLKDFIKKLPEDSFLKCHRSYIINTNEVSEAGTSHVMINDTEIPVSTRHKKEVQALFS